MSYLNVFSIAVVCFIFPSLVQAQTGTEFEAFQSQYEVVLPSSIVVPTVVELPLSEARYEYPYFAVQEATSGTVVAHYYRPVSNQKSIPVAVKSGGQYLYSLTDSSYTTSHDFPLFDDNGSSVILGLETDIPVLSSSLTFSLAPNVTLPTTVTITAVVDGVEQTLLSRYRPSSSRVSFPATRASRWNVTFTYSQPLRITEVVLTQSSPESTFSHSLRWLAQPGMSYEVYSNPDRVISIRGQEAGDLANNDGVTLLPAVVPKDNVAYRMSDIDEDDIADLFDNCVSVANTDQVDVDANNRGDVCDDFDKDGIRNSLDNCPNVPNRNQADEDGDGIGNSCDDEESRVTEKYVWIPWAGMGLAVSVMFLLAVLVARTKPKKDEAALDENVDIPPSQ